jgi:hypothetical protein
MILGIIPTSQELLDDARSYFPGDYINKLSNKAFLKESIIGRLQISRVIGNTYFPETIEWIPHMYDENFWSLSHKQWVVFFGVWKTNIGVDIELVKPRDISLLDTFLQSEYDALGWKNWDNFYRFWTCHESMVKYDKETNYKQGMYRLLSFEQKPCMVSGINFEYELIFWKQQMTYTLLSGRAEDYIYSICQKTYEN